MAFDDLSLTLADSRKDAINMGIAVGTIAFVKYTELCNDKVMGKTLIIVQAAIMVETMRLPKCRLHCMRCEDCAREIGLGAAVAAFGVEPDVALALDVTTSGDVPGVKETDTNIKMGKGPALTVTDSGLITHPKILCWLQETANKENIDIQLESGLPGSTDAARIALTRQGIPSGTISIPTRYIHSPVSVMNLKDVENGAKLAASAIQRIKKHF